MHGFRLRMPFYAGRAMSLLTLLLAQAGSGSGGFGGGGGGGGGGGFGGGGGSGSGGGDPVVAIVVFGLFGLVVVYLLIRAARYRRKVRERDRRVRTASAEAAEDDGYFAADELEHNAAALFMAAQMAWDARDRQALATLVGPDLLVEWNRRLDDFDRKHWHNRVQVMGEPDVRYVGITNREDDTEDRAVVRITAKLRAFVEDARGNHIMRKADKDEYMTLQEYWTLARRNGQWMVQSIEQQTEGDHHLDEPIVASPWSDDRRLEDESVTELAVADALPEGFTTADLAEVDFAGDARARALDLSVADGRFAPDVLEAAARRAVAAWAEAVDGADAALEAVAAPQAVAKLLYAGDTTRTTRLVVRGPRVKRIRIETVQVEHVPATMTIAVELGGSRYVENRDTTTVVSGSKDRVATFTERWTLALDGPPDSPWRIVDAM
jgi:predicted lipid-binding transport protein (Tim44 family)